MFERGALALIILMSMMSAAGKTESLSLQPAWWADGLKLPEAIDLNPDPHIVEIELEARVAGVVVAAKRVKAWTYNGSLPGPLIRVRVGDRLIVHFSNKLPQPTTVHWHGLRIAIAMDGVPGHSQPDAQPGESFTFDFIVPDAGLFWYHPHVMSAVQIGFGLYGALLVDDPNEHVGVDDQLVLVLSDIALKKTRPRRGASSGLRRNGEDSAAHPVPSCREGGPHSRPARVEHRSGADAAGARGCHADGHHARQVVAPAPARGSDPVADLIEYYTDTVFPRIRDMGYQAVRTEPHKYIHYLELTGMDELYHLERDPYEMDNIIDAPAGRALLPGLKAELAKLQLESGHTH